MVDDSCPDPVVDRLTILTLSERLGQSLLENGRMLCVAESCTGGGLAEAMTAVSGSSAWFECGWVTYTNTAKTRLLGVPPAVFEEHGAVSAECVSAMTVGALARADADYAVAISGVAGPGGGSADKPVGTVWIAWRFRDQHAAGQGEFQDSGVSQTALKFHFSGDRLMVRDQAVFTAMQGVFNHLGTGEWAVGGVSR
ncbi:MAG TPA: CinA family protein [Halothiobacillus sp.]|nr:CinA family protein [Halothiobacillus sp.]